MVNMEHKHSRIPGLLKTKLPVVLQKESVLPIGYAELVWYITAYVQPESRA